VPAIVIVASNDSKELLSWLTLHVDSLKGGEELATPLIVCMQDKTAAVRALAESLLTAMMSKATISKTSTTTPLSTSSSLLYSLCWVP
jgi:hypothetical protein